MQADEKTLTKLVNDVERLTRELSNYMRESENYDVGVGKDVEQIKKDITEIKLLITQNYVRREEFNPVQKIVYGLVSVILMAVMGAIIALVIRQ